MRSFFHGLRSWWFNTLAPAYRPLTTLDAQEEMRKRRLLSIILLISLILSLLSLGVVFNVQGLRTSMNVLLCGTILFALWCNRYGYLKQAKQAATLEPDAVALTETHTELATALTEAHAELEAMRDKLESAKSTIHRQALVDVLTELPNHRAIMGQLDKEMERARRYGRALSLLFFDVDRLKLINDTYGYTVGDVVLRQIAERVGSAVRGGDTLGRFDGATFVSLLPETDLTNAKTVAERIRSVIAAEPLATSEVTGGVTITVSIGLATYPDDAASEKELLAQADEAMYIAKRLGRNQVRTAKEALQMSDDNELMARLQQEEQEEVGQQEEVTPERLRETHTLRVVYSLMTLLERRDENISMHSHAVSRLAIGIAEIMGLESKQVSRIGMAALLHDIGKVTIPDVLLQKASTLSDDERVLVRAHAELGAQIMEVSPFLHDLVPAVRHHHEHWDGCGYPDELAGEHIPLAARIIGVAEAYDSMRRGDTYQTKRPLEEAMFELQRCSGTQFDPAVVQALVTLLTKLHKPSQSLPLVR